MTNKTNKPPNPPCNRLIYESDGIQSTLCPNCGSSLKRKINFNWLKLIKTKKCIQPSCFNYYKGTS